MSTVPGLSGMLTVRNTAQLALRRSPPTFQGQGLTAVFRAGPWLSNRLPILPVRRYAQMPPGGASKGAGGFPGFNMFGQPQEKGDALKQFVSALRCEKFEFFMLNTKFIRVLTLLKWRGTENWIPPLAGTKVSRLSDYHDY